MHSQQNPDRWAVLIGIDHYDDGNHLGGCANDAILVSSFLHKNLGVPHKNMFLHLSQKAGDKAPDSLDSNIKQLKATADAVWDSLMTISKAVKGKEAQSFLHFHFSGHGDRQSTIFRNNSNGRRAKRNLHWFNRRQFNDGSTFAEASSVFKELVKQSDANDEMLCFPDGKDITDVEFAMMLASMSSNELSISVTLDCCFAGGATRGGRDEQHFKVRCKPHAQNSGRAISGSTCNFEEESVISAEFDAWKSRNCALLNSMLSHRHENVNFIMACQEDQVAAEGTIRGHGSSKPYGLFTATLIRRLQVLGDHVDHTTYLEFQGILGVVCHDLMRRKQIPSFYGADSRLLFHREEVTRDFREHAFLMITPQKTLTISRGKVTDARHGDMYCLVGEDGEAIASTPLIKLTHIGDFESQAEFESSGAGEDNASIRKLCDTSRVVRLAKRAPVGVRLTHDGSKNTRDPLKVIRTQWNLELHDHFSLVHQESRSTNHLEVELIIRVCHDGVEICDGEGKAFERLRKISTTSASISDGTMMKELMLALVGMNKYQRFRRMGDQSGKDNPFEFKLKSTTVDEPYDENGDFVGSLYDFTFTNKLSSTSLYFTVLNIQPGYGIKVLYPNHMSAARGQRVNPLETHNEFHETQIEVAVAERFFSQYKADRKHHDILKVIVSTEGVDLRSFEQDDVLDPTPTPKGSDHNSRNTKARTRKQISGWWIEEHPLRLSGRDPDSSSNTSNERPKVKERAVSTP
ncbi:hypothetical protein PG989_004799 [Apiospora arundinis]